MSADKQEKKSSGEDSPKKGEDSKDSVVTSGWSDNAKVRRRKFPGPAGSGESLRITMTRDAYADLTANAKASLDAEVCGVLIGDLCEDDDGPFVSVEGVIAGSSARKGKTHVTFTQETWTQIHEEKDQRYPKRQIVGWYHTHPGFGVEFSEMDMFVQKNFFPGAGQIAFVTDPLGGDEAILANVDGAVVPVKRFWVDGRERTCQTPAGTESKSQAAGAIPASVEKTLRAMDERIGQLMQMVDGQTAWIHRFILGTGMFLAMCVVAYFAFEIYHSYTHDNEPPQIHAFAEVPVQIGDKSVLLGVAVVKWDVPPSLNATLIAIEKERQAAEKAAAATQPTQPATKP